MKSIDSRLSVTRGPDPRVHPRIMSGDGNEAGMPMRILAAVVALWASLAACPVLAQEAAPAAGGDAPQAGGGPGADAPAKGTPDGAAPASRDVDLVPPVRGPAGLHRHAFQKALIANAVRKTAGLPLGAARFAPPLRPGLQAGVQRNAIGAAMPAAHPPGRDVAVTIPAGTRLTTAGAPAGIAGHQTHQVPVPTSAGPALHGAAINGATMGRMASGPASIGGPARDRSGINGTAMRPKH
jgi:hypothetical protein